MQTKTVKVIPTSEQHSIVRVRFVANVSVHEYPLSVVIFFGPSISGQRKQRDVSRESKVDRNRAVSDGRVMTRNDENKNVEAFDPLLKFPSLSARTFNPFM